MKKEEMAGAFSGIQVCYSHHAVCRCVWCVVCVCHYGAGMCGLCVWCRRAVGDHGECVFIPYTYIIFSWHGDREWSGGSFCR